MAAARRQAPGHNLCYDDFLFFLFLSFFIYTGTLMASFRWARYIKKKLLFLVQFFLNVFWGFGREILSIKKK